MSTLATAGAAASSTLCSTAAVFKLSLELAFVCLLACSSSLGLRLLSGGTVFPLADTTSEEMAARTIDDRPQLGLETRSCSPGLAVTPKKRKGGILQSIDSPSLKSSPLMHLHLLCMQPSFGTITKQTVGTWDQSDLALHMAAATSSGAKNGSQTIGSPRCSTQTRVGSPWSKICLTATSSGVGAAIRVTAELAPCN